MPVVYSFVSRGLNVLVDHQSPVTLTSSSSTSSSTPSSPTPPNFAELSKLVLKKTQPANGESMDGKKLTYVYNKYTYNFMGLRDFVFLCIADEEAGRVLPFSFLNDLSEAFFKQYRDDDSSIVRGREHYAGFQSTLIARVEKYATIGASSTTPPREERTELLGLSGVPAVSTRAETKLNAIQKQMDDVKTVMNSNIEKMIARGEGLDLLKDKSSDLANHSERFRRSSTKLRQSMYCADVKTTAAIIGGILVTLHHSSWVWMEMIALPPCVVE